MEERARTESFDATDPAVIGLGYEAELIDDNKLIYKCVDDQGYIREIVNVRVGGIPWNRCAWQPAQGQWNVVSREDGTFKLGTVTLGGVVRCDLGALVD